ncbi:DUF4381 domain-containing protein [Thalassotalea fusca]
MDPLAQLKDVHLPEQIHNYPIAPGWWLLAIIIVTVIFWAIKSVINRKKFNHKRKVAKKLLDSGNLSNAEIIVLLKTVAMHYVPRENVASLHGDTLADFLQTQLPEKHQANFNTLINGKFSQHYSPTQQNEVSLIEAANLWLTRAQFEQLNKNQAQGVSKDV